MPQITRFLPGVVAEPVRGRVGASQIVPRALSRFGGQVERIGGLLAEVEVRKNQALNQAEVAATVVRSQTEMTDALLELEANPDPRTHRKLAQQAILRIAEDAVSTATNEEVRTALETRLSAVLGQADRQAAGFERQLVVDASEAALANLLRSLEREAIAAPDQQSREVRLLEIQREIQERVDTGVLSEVEATKLLQAIQRRIPLGVARRVGFDDPDAARRMIASGEVTFKTEQDRQRFEEFLDSRERQLEVQERKEERRREKIEKEVRDALVDELYTRAREGDIGLDEFQEIATKNGITGADFRLIDKAIRDVVAAGGAGDEALEKSLELRIRLGEITQSREIMPLVGPRGLNNDQANSLVTVLNQQRDIADITKDPLYKQALADLKFNLGVRVLAETLDPKDPIRAEAIREFNDRARAGERDFIRLGREIVEKWSPIIGIERPLTNITAEMEFIGELFEKGQGQITESEANRRIKEFQRIESEVQRRTR